MTGHKVRIVAPSSVKYSILIRRKTPAKSSCQIDLLSNCALECFYAKNILVWIRNDTDELVFGEQLASGCANIIAKVSKVLLDDDTLLSIMFSCSRRLRRIQRPYSRLHRRTHRPSTVDDRTESGLPADWHHIFLSPGNAGILYVGTWLVFSALSINLAYEKLTREFKSKE